MFSSFELYVGDAATQMFLKRSQLHNHVQALLLDLECFQFTIKAQKPNLIPKIKVK